MASFFGKTWEQEMEFSYNQRAASRLQSAILTKDLKTVKKEVRHIIADDISLRECLLSQEITYYDLLMDAMKSPEIFSYLLYQTQLKTHLLNEHHFVKMFSRAAEYDMDGIIKILLDYNQLKSQTMNFFVGVAIMYFKTDLVKQIFTNYEIDPTAGPPRFQKYGFIIIAANKYLQNNDVPQKGVVDFLIKETEFDKLQMYLDLKQEKLNGISLHGLKTDSLNWLISYLQHNFDYIDNMKQVVNVLNKHDVL